MARVKRNAAFKQAYLIPENHRKWVDAAIVEGSDAISMRAPVDTGYLRYSFRTRHWVGPHRTRTGGNSVGPVVRYEAIPKHAIYTEVGTGLYGPLNRWITPKRAKYLSWVDKGTGQRVFAKRVRGQRPKRYFRRGLEATFGKRNVKYYGVTAVTIFTTSPEK